MRRIVASGMKRFNFHRFTVGFTIDSTVDFTIEGRHMAKDWNRRVFLRSSVAGAGATVALGSGGAHTASATPERAPTPRGRAVCASTAPPSSTPRRCSAPRSNAQLTWELTAPGRGARQSAYQVRVALTEKDLREGRRLVWDSGRVESDRSVGIAYAGPALRPRTRYHWQVRVWDSDGRPFGVERPALVGDNVANGRLAGLLDRSGGPAEPPRLRGVLDLVARLDHRFRPVGPRWFRTDTLPTGSEVRRARLVAADDDFTLYVDGQQVLYQPQQTDAWRTGHLAEVTEQVRGASGGRIVVAAVATNRDNGSANPGGLLLRLIVETTSGDTVELVTGDGWRCVDSEQQGWQRPDFEARAPRAGPGPPCSHPGDRAPGAPACPSASPNSPLPCCAGRSASRRTSCVPACTSADSPTTRPRSTESASAVRSSTPASRTTRRRCSTPCTTSRTASGAAPTRSG